MDLQHLLPDLALQLRDPPLRPAPLPVPGKGVARPLPELTSPAVQHVGIHFQTARHLGDAGRTVSRTVDLLRVARDSPLI